MEFQPYIIIALFILFGLGSVLGVNITFLLYHVRVMYNRQQSDAHSQQDIRDYLDKIEQRLAQIAQQKPIVVKQSNSEDSRYHAARSMLNKGMTKDEIITSFGISKTEVDLLQAMSKIV